RRHLLESLVEPGPHWQVPATHPDGAALYAAVVEQGLEGVVAKRPDSKYRPGGRTSEWIKTKVRRRQEVVVGGWAPGTGGRRSTIGGLLSGYHLIEDDRVSSRLRYAGRVGSGLTGAELIFLEKHFATIATDACPFDPVPVLGAGSDARWVQ